MERSKLEVGRIISDWGGAFFAERQPVARVRNVFRLLSVCRTRHLGGHVEACPQCGEIHVSYNSCRDRHCPKCQHKDREEWIAKRKEEVIDAATYFHVVFTIPDCLHRLAMGNQSLFYGCMFRAAWLTLAKFFAKLGLQGGMSAILHTWGSNLFYHPHLHCIVPGGGIGPDGAWRHLRKCERGGGAFLFPVRALSLVFRAKFIDLLARKLKAEGAQIPDDVRRRCFDKEWVVYSRPPAKGAEQVLEYLGRYAYRVAISNSRLLGYTNEGTVTYDYKDYRQGGRHKTMSMHAIEFLSLFAQHILPEQFMRIRHYGFLAPSNRDKLRKVQEQLGSQPVPKVRTKKPYAQICIERGWEVGVCPHCKCAMEVIEVLAPIRAPPFAVRHRKEPRPDRL